MADHSGGMDITFVAANVPPRFGGAELLATRQAAYLAREGHRVTFLTDVPDPDPIPGVRLVSVASELPAPLRDLAQLQALTRRLPSSGVVHCMTAGRFSLVGVGAARLRGRPVVLEVTLFGKDDLPSVGRRPFGRLQQALFRRAHRVVSMSPLLQETVVGAGMDPDRCRVIPNAVDTDLFRPAREDEKEELRRALGLPRSGPVLLAVGAVIPRKNTLGLVRIFRRLLEGGLDHGTLVLAGPTEGDPEYADRVRTCIREHGLDETVRLVGRQENVQEWMRASDLFLMASTSEGFGTVIVEAMSTGLPPVVVGIPGITEHIIEDGRTGRIAADLDHAASAAGALLGDGSLRRAMGREAREEALRRFSFPVVMDAYLELYAGLLRDPSSSA